jgi:DNA-binding CsgD family transcriptional regulator
VKELIMPYLEKLKKHENHKQRSYVEIIESNLKNIVAPFLPQHLAKFSKLTGTETQIIDLVKKGKTTKEIAEILDCSTKTIDSHRNHIRRKIGITNKKVDLRSFLLSGK